MTISPTALQFLVGTTAQLTSTVKNSAGNMLYARTVTWSSSATSIATVDSTGLVTGVAPGSVTITATSESKSGTAAVRVDAVESVTVWMAPDTLLLGEERQFLARVVGSQGTLVIGLRATWTSSDPSVAAVDTLGFVRAGAGGSATITATFEGESGTADVTVLVINFTSVDAGTFYTCGLTTSGAAYCWGLLGVGPTTETCPGFTGSPVPCTTRPLAVSTEVTFASLSVANGFICGLTTRGAAYCWGGNRDGQLGNGSTVNSTTPVAVSGNLVFASISAGGFFACGLTTEGEAYCWGSNNQGQLGTTVVSDTCEDIFEGPVPCSTVPVAVTGGLTFTWVSAGGGHTCGLTATGAAYCWGSNAVGELGDGTTTDHTTPVPVSGGLTFTSVSAFNHTCGVTTTAEAYCWGWNELAQLGDGTTTNRMTPVAVSGGLSFASVNAGGFHTCGITTSGAAYCWGNNFDHQLGDGTDLTRTAPSAVSGGLSFATVSPHFFHTCGLTTSSKAYCWGANDLGQLGIGRSNEFGEGPRSPVPVLGQPSVNYSSLRALGRSRKKSQQAPRVRRRPRRLP